MISEMECQGAQHNWCRWCSVARLSRWSRETATYGSGHDGGTACGDSSWRMVGPHGEGTCSAVLSETIGLAPGRGLTSHPPRSGTGAKPMVSQRTGVVTTGGLYDVVHERKQFTAKEVMKVDYSIAAKDSMIDTEADRNEEASGEEDC